MRIQVLYPQLWYSLTREHSKERNGVVGKCLSMSQAIVQCQIQF